MSKEDFISPGGVRKKPASPYSEKEDESATSGYGYGKLKRKLKVGIEVEGGVGNGLARVGNGTRSTTGTLSVTGVGFKPYTLRIVASYLATQGATSDGETDGITSRSMNWFANPAAPTVEQTSNLVNVNWSGTGTTVANLVSFDDDGFTLNFTSIGPAISFYYVCRK